MTYRLIYKSIASPHVTDADFRTIAMFSSIRNKQDNISGLLLHVNGRIMQVLEGPESAVKRLYSNIEKDPRHRDIEVVMSERADQPYFQEWSMGYRPMESEAQMDAFFELNTRNLEDAIPDAASEDMRRVVGEFASAAGLKSR